MRLHRWSRVMHPLTATGFLRYEIVRSLFKDVPEGSTLLEVGAGSGALASRLADHVRYIGFEPDMGSYEVAARRLGGRGSLYNSVLPAAPTEIVDVMTAFEVLEHVEDDTACLSSWREWLRPGGQIFLSVPADPGRFGPADEAVGHFRRYTERDLSLALTAAGFCSIVTVRYGYPVANVSEALRSVLARNARRDQFERHSRTLASGRHLQPSVVLGIGIQLLLVPLAAIQLPLSRRGRGRGIVAVATRC